MADQRGTDFSWGQLGEATYDTVEKTWTFLREPVIPKLLQPIQPLKECLAASSDLAEDISDENVRDVTRKRKDWKTAKAVKNFSDLGGAVSFLKTLDQSKEEDSVRITTADVIATGVAKLRSITNKGYRAFPVIAASYGAAGHILRITKPREEDYTWASHKDDKIRLLNLERSEHGYWSNGAAAIESVTFAIDSEGLQTWLAVRQAASTTILRPMVHPFPVAQSVPPTVHKDYPPSRIDSNLACAITTEATCGRAHVDVAFNPWYTRQFAILDDAGYWKTWYIEGSRLGPKKTTTGKYGYIYDDPGMHDAAPDPADAGWGRFIWVGDVSTIAVCNLRNLAMFATKSEPRRLKCPQIITKGSSGRILEMKRNPVWHDKFFILTDTRLYLLATTAEGCHTVMSTTHFREAQSANLKLEVYGRDETCTALIYSSNIGLVSVYRFQLDLDAVSPITWSTDAFYLPQTESGIPTRGLQGLCLLPAVEPPERWNKWHTRKDGRWHSPKQFYQAFTLSTNLAISQTLLAEGALLVGPSADRTSVYETIAPPNESSLVPEKIKTVRRDDVAVDDLVAVVPDGLAEDMMQGPKRLNFWAMKKAAVEPEVLEKKTNAISAQKWYELATAEKPFYCGTGQGQCRGHASPLKKPCDGLSFQKGDLRMRDYIEKIVGGVQRRKDVEQQGLSTLHDLADFSNFTEDIDNGTNVLRMFIDAFFDDDESSNVAIILRASNVSRILELEDGKAAESAVTDMSTIYDKLIELWVAPLPAETSGSIRIAKERLIRNIAADLALSSLIAHVQEKLKAPENQESIKSSQFTQSQAVGSQKSHLPSATPDPNLPSSQPSIDGGMTEQYSQLLTPEPSYAGSQASTMGEAPEDPSITLLRSYALGVKTQQPLGKTRADILGTWKLGSDIRNFRWRAPDLFASVEGIEEEDNEQAKAEAKAKQEHRERKERKKSEKILRRQHRASMLPSQGEWQNRTDERSLIDEVRRREKAGWESIGGFGSQFSQSQTPGFGTPVPRKAKRKSMSALTFASQGFGGGTPIERPGAGAGTSFGSGFGGGFGGASQGAGTPSARPGAASQGPGASASFGTSFGSQAGMPMTQPVQGAFGGRRSLGGRQSLGGQPERKRRKGF